MSRLSGQTRGLRMGSEVIGRRGLLLLVAAGMLAGALAAVGSQTQGLASVSASVAQPSGKSGGTHSTTGASSPASSPGTTAPSPSTTAPPTSRPGSTPPATAKLGPALSSTPYASYAFQVYPGTPSAATRQALAGFKVAVARHGAGIQVTVTVAGSSQPPIQKTYAASDHVYFIEASLGDDSGNSEFNLGDDGIVLTNAQGRVLQ